MQYAVPLDAPYRPFLQYIYTKLENLRLSSATGSLAVYNEQSIQYHMRILIESLGGNNDTQQGFGNVLGSMIFEKRNELDQLFNKIRSSRKIREVTLFNDQIYACLREDIIPTVFHDFHHAMQAFLTMNLSIDHVVGIGWHQDLAYDAYCAVLLEDHPSNQLTGEQKVELIDNLSRYAPLLVFCPKAFEECNYPKPITFESVTTSLKRFETELLESYCFVSTTCQLFPLFQISQEAAKNNVTELRTWYKNFSNTTFSIRKQNFEEEAVDGYEEDSPYKTPRSYTKHQITPPGLPTFATPTNSNSHAMMTRSKSRSLQSPTSPSWVYSPDGTPQSLTQNSLVRDNAWSSAHTGPKQFLREVTSQPVSPSGSVTPLYAGKIRGQL